MGFTGDVLGLKDLDDDDFGIITEEYLETGITVTATVDGTSVDDTAEV
jgi:hypothetical protein